MAKKTLFNHEIKDEVYFLDFGNICRGEIINRKSLILDDGEKVNGYVILIKKDTKPDIFECWFTCLEDKKVFATKKDLIYNIDKS